jgi:hypothetical protein
MHVSRESLRRISKNVLNLKAYKLHKAQLLTEKMKRVRLERAKVLLQLDAVRDWETIVFSDEKIFTIEQRLNSQNDRMWLSPSSAASINDRRVSRSQKPASVMVWAAVTATGKTPLHFVDPGVKIDQVYYRTHILDNVLLPWTKQHFGQKSWTFQQDSAPSHRAKSTQDWCSKNFPNFITSAQWPPYSPDLNPLDFSLWSILESKVCSSSHKNVESLKRDLVAAWNDIDEDLLRRICANFADRLRRVVRVKGDHFEM